MNAADSVRHFMSAFVSHVDKHGLPAVRSAIITDGKDQYEDVPLSACVVTEGPLSEVAWALLQWAATLDDVSVELWRHGRLDDVQVQVHGRLRSGLPVTLYGYVAFGAGMFPNLEREMSHDVPVSALLAWAKPCDGPDSTDKGVVV